MTASNHSAAPSNFAFLDDRFPVLARFGRLAERYAQIDPNSCLMKLGMLGEAVVNLIYDIDGIPRHEGDDAARRIQRLFYEGDIDRSLADVLHALRKKRNLAAHQGLDSAADAQALLPMAHSVAEWFYETYGDYQYQHHPYIPPAQLTAEARARAATERKAKSAVERHAEDARDARDAQAAAATAKPQAATRDERRKQAERAALHRHKTEAETRMEIDAQLRRVGWEADTVHLTYAKGARPEKGKNRAIAEWPTVHGAADYMLFCGTRMVAVIEAKAAQKDIPSVLDGQARGYAASVREADDDYTIGRYGDYRVPLIFATNGRPYLAQYEEKSGIWFQDLRDPMNLAKALHGWMSPEGIEHLLARELEASPTPKLQKTLDDELTDPTGLNLRPYQVAAVRAAEQAVADGKRSILLAMATGTGKTRTVLAMIYRFLRTGRFHRILFLVDRNVLGSQAEDAFHEVRLGELKTLQQIYNVQGLDAPAALARETRVQVATVQSLVRRILFAQGDDAMPAVTDFDLVIIDEAHRGYVLDRDMTEDELLYRDQRDYMSKYKSVVDYFDAVRIALTATPALHTTEIFGAPVYTYSYREAVIDGYLVDHDAPIRITTELSRGGIHYAKGETPALLDPETGELLNGAQLADELDFDVSDFNKKVITENFNRTVLAYIAKHYDPSSREEGKMLIFAANDAHADLIVQILRELYAGQCPPEAIRKITGTIENGNQKKIRAAVQRFKNEQYPSIAVTVDLLTTGVDVPEITNLVFLRRVKSRILFEQMLGRATRLCPSIHKDAFTIYDAVGTYDILERVSSMKPVAAETHDTVEKLLGGVATARTAQTAAPSPENEKKLRVAIERVIARLQRKAKLLTDEQKTDARDALGEPLTKLLARLRTAPPVDAAQTLLTHREPLAALETVHAPRKGIIVDHHEDGGLAVEIGLGDSGTERPEDYLAAFTRYITENRDRIEALRLACTSPRDLTYQDLKHLRKMLAQEHFTERQLTAAYQEQAGQGGRKEDLVADIISLIRRATLGTRLTSHADRIHRAIARILDDLRQRPDYTKAQENVLRQIEKYFAHDENYVVNVTTFDEEPDFEETGGSKRYDKIFAGRLKDVVDQLNTYLYDETDETIPDGGKSA